MPSFPFGTNQPYYSNSEPERESPISKMSKYGLSVAGIAGIGALGAMSVGNGENLFDYYYRGWRVAGYASPYGILASLRVPELMSPFLSEKFQKQNLGLNINDVIHIEGDYFHNNDSLRYIKSLTGLDTTDKAIRSKLQTQGLVFKRDKNSRFGRGSLYLGRDKIKEDIVMMERDISGYEQFNVKANVNQAAKASVSVIDEDVNPEKLLRAKRNNSYKYIPVHSPTGKFSSWADLKDRMHYWRGIGAFYAQRLNEATITIGESIPVIGEHLAPFFKGEMFAIKPGTFSKSWMRYATGIYGKLAVGGMLLSEYDWSQRYGAFGEGTLSNHLGYAISAGTLAGMTVGLHPELQKYFPSLFKGSKPMRAAAAVGTIAYAIQAMLPGFDKGLVAGTSQTLTNVSLLHAGLGEITGASTWRRTLEDYFPGSTDFATSAAAGFAGYGAFSLFHYKDSKFYRYKKQMDEIKKTTAAKDYNLITDVNERNKEKIKDYLEDRFLAWYKLANNLDPTDNVDDFHNLRRQGKWLKDIIPYDTENKVFAKYWDTLSSTDWAKKIFAAGSHLASSSNARFKGITGGALFFTAGFLGHSLISGKLLGGRLDDLDTLQNQAAGLEDVPIRKSRWWGGGGNPYEGGKISYYRPSINALIQSDSYYQGLMGEKAKDTSPLYAFILKNFTYSIEEDNYYRRPYPITSPAFADVPIIGPLLGATIGQLIKPSIHMHQEEWHDKEKGYLNVPKRLDSNPAIELGGQGIGTPEDPYSFWSTYGNQVYKFREAAGLAGFAENFIQALATGEETLSTGRPLYAESNQMWSPNARFWDLEIGGAASLSEIPRRYFTKERIQNRNRYNPIRNNMPSWIPEDFRYGDPYTKVMSGYARLPGEGYAALHPEMKGIDPEDYPLIHRYNILSNIASYSQEFATVRNKMLGRIKRNQATPEELFIFYNRQKQLASQKLKRNYFVESPEQQQDPYLKRLIRNTYFEAIDTVRKIAAPIEYTTFGGMRPSQKFLPPADVLSDYKNFAIYGSETSFWSLEKAWQDYLGPMSYGIGRILGYSGVPPEEQHRRNVNEYFDKLTFYKYQKLAEEAERKGDSFAAKEYRKFSRKTIYGLRNGPTDAMIGAVLPTEEKERFEGFRRLSDEEKQKELIALLPEDQKAIFSSMYDRHNNPKRKNKNKSSDQERIALLEEYYKQNEIPKGDWIGWNPKVDLNDIKLKYLEENNFDPSQFGFWPNDSALMDRKPYLEDIELPRINYRQSMELELNKIKQNGDNLYLKSNSSVFDTGMNYLEINDDRQMEIDKQESYWDER